MALDDLVFGLEKHARQIAVGRGEPVLDVGLKMQTRFVSCA